MSDRHRDLGHLLTTSARYKVDFLHRTVRDFLETKDVQMELQERAVVNVYDPYKILCRAFVGMLKALPLHNVSQRTFSREHVDDVLDIVDEFS